MTPSTTVGARVCGRRAAGGVARPVSDLDDPRPVGAGVVYQVGEDLVLLVVDDRGVVVAGGAVGVGGLHQSVVGGDEEVDLGFVHQGVVGGDAGLSAAEEFAEDDVGHGLVPDVSLGHDGRRLAAELQRDGDEVVTGRLHHGSPDLGAAGEDEVVERQ
ncbi:hypothetical protein QBA36_44075 [Streptomyces stelliscabiei]|nr:hypothetical protein [Streptomyces sp. 1222.2]